MTKRELLEAAMAGFQQQLTQIKSRIREIRVQLKEQVPRCAIHGTRLQGSICATCSILEDDVPVIERARPKIKISAAGKRRIAAAQKARWAAFHKKKHQGGAR